MTAPSALTPTFKSLSAVAFLSLWGLMAANGTLVTLLKTAWSGVFPDKTRLQTGYTGIVLIDFPISILVAFFYGLQNLPGTPSHLMLVDLVAVLLVINMMTIVESRRLNPAKRLQSSLLWQYSWNCTGVALILPIYSLFHVKSKFEDATISRRLPRRESQALPLTAVLSLLVPVPLLLPAAMGATPTQIQIGLVLYLTTPACCVLFQILASVAMSKYAATSSSGWFATKPVMVAYLIVGTASALTHLAVVSDVLFWTRSPNLTLTRLYLPDHTTVQQGQDNVLKAGALLFFQWDYIIINLTSLCHGYFLLQRKAFEIQRPGDGVGGLFLIMVCLTAVFGPGAGLVFALLWHEDEGEVILNNLSRSQRSYGT